MQFVAEAFLLAVMAFEQVAVGVFALWFAKRHKFDLNVVLDVSVSRSQLFSDERTAVWTERFVINGDGQLLWIKREN